jgi:hypothetical protein
MFPDAYAFGEAELYRQRRQAAENEEFAIESKAAAAEAVSRMIRGVLRESQSDEIAELAEEVARHEQLVADAEASPHVLDPYAGPPLTRREAECWLAEARNEYWGAREASTAAAALDVGLRAAARASADPPTIVRDVFGNPFRPVAVDARWRTPKVTDMARCIYLDRAFDVLPMLADLLEEAGCMDPDILGHCRGSGPHVRGCWVLDLSLGMQ